VLGLYCSVIAIPRGWHLGAETGGSFFKDVCMSFILCAFVGGYTDCKNTRSMNMIKTEKSVIVIMSLLMFNG
jgi:hypothetical protein